MNADKDLVIRDKEHRIIALCAGMSQEERDQFIRDHISEGAHYSVLKLKPGQYGELKKFDQLIKVDKEKRVRFTVTGGRA